MESFLKKVNATGMVEQKPVLKICNMEVGKKFEILKLKNVNTRYGRSIVCETAEKSIFLPKRMVDVITEEEVNEINSKQVKLSIVFEGFKDVDGSGGVPMVKLVES